MRLNNSEIEMFNVCATIFCVNTQLWRAAHPWNVFVTQRSVNSVEREPHLALIPHDRAMTFKKSSQ